MKTSKLATAAFAIVVMALQFNAAFAGILLGDAVDSKTGVCEQKQSPKVDHGVIVYATGVIVYLTGVIVYLNDTDEHVDCGIILTD